MFIVLSLILTNLVIVKDAGMLNTQKTEMTSVWWLTVHQQDTYMYRVLCRYKLTASGGFGHTINHSFSLPIVQVANMRNNRWALSFNNTQMFCCHWRKHSAALENDTDFFSINQVSWIYERIKIFLWCLLAGSQNCHQNHKWWEVHICCWYTFFLGSNKVPLTYSGF